MTSDIICKTVYQYSKGQISTEDMERLQKIARDYCNVKNYVYARFGGIASLHKLYPGYTIQNEMTESGLRKDLELPSVYFYLAIFDALRDIKAQWTRIKRTLSVQVGKNEGFTDEEKHYLRFVIKVANAFDAVLNRKEVLLQGDIEKQYLFLSKEIDKKKLHNYLCRQVRKHLIKLHTELANGFSLSERAYRYGDHGIYISSKEKRKRIFIPLTDNNRYTSQLYIRLYVEERKLKVCIPVYMTPRSYEDYCNEVGVSLGMDTMLTTDQGHPYGGLFGQYHREYVDWIWEEMGNYRKAQKGDQGRKKYDRRKNRYEERAHSYINHELNQFFAIEKPKVIYIPKLPKAGGGDRTSSDGERARFRNGKINHSITLWQRGYICRRLEQKCKERSVEIVEVFGKDISNVCSCCGSLGRKEKGFFICISCGLRMEGRTNAAKNAKIRGGSQA